MNGLKKFILLTSHEKTLLFEATLTLVSVKLVVLMLPLRWYSRYLGMQHTLTSENDGPGYHEVIYKVAAAIVRSRRLIPWAPRCLVDAISAKIMLRKRGIGSTLYFGVAKKDKKMIAHAWLRCGKTLVTGKRGMEKFVVVSTFA